LVGGIVGREVVSELIELSSVISDIYDAAMEPSLWQQALSSICLFIGAPSAVLYWHDAATERSEALHLFNDEPEYTRLYFEKYLPLNPMFPAATFVDAGVVTTSEDIMPRSELVKTRFYNEWIKPQGLEDSLSVNLEKGVLRASLLNVRTAIVPTEAMRHRLTLLVPHLQRSVSIGRLFDQGSAKEDALTRTLDHVRAAVFLIAVDGTLTFVNARAKQLLDDAALVCEHDGILRAVEADTDAMLQRLIKSASEGDASLGTLDVALPMTTLPEEQWFAHVLPLSSGQRRNASGASSASAALFIRQAAPNAPPPLETIAKRHALSAAEVRILDAMLKVDGVKEVARLLGLSEATVKTHLQNLFRKTKTTRQSELVKLIAGL
jgi:DNA-binding CsgD family transcriptional regulator